MNPYSKPVRVARILWYRIFHARRARHSITANLRGLKISLSSANTIAESVYSSGFERAERVILAKLIKPGDYVVDVGANIGFFTCLFAQAVGLRGRVIAFDPTPLVFRQLKRNIEANRLTDRVTCRNVGLSDKAGRAILNCFPEGNEVYNSFGAKTPFDSSISVESQIEVEISTLDIVLKEFFPAESTADLFIKIDVEGYEQNVLMGGLASLRNLKNCSLMIELYEPAAKQCGNSTTQTIAALREVGFSAYEISGKRHYLKKLGAVSVNQPNADSNVSQNIFFLKPSVEKRLRQQSVILD